MDILDEALDGRYVLIVLNLSKRIEEIENHPGF